MKAQAKTAAKPYGGQDAKRPGLKVQIEGRAFTMAVESEPLPVVWGTVQRGGTYIVPVYGVTATPITTEVGK